MGSCSSSQSDTISIKVEKLKPFQDVKKVDKHGTTISDKSPTTVRKEPVKHTLNKNGNKNVVTVSHAAYDEWAWEVEYENTTSPRFHNKILQTSKMKETIKPSTHDIVQKQSSHVVDDDEEINEAVEELMWEAKFNELQQRSPNKIILAPLDAKTRRDSSRPAFTIMKNGSDKLKPVETKKARRKKKKAEKEIIKAGSIEDIHGNLKVDEETRKNQLVVNSVDIIGDSSTVTISEEDEKLIAEELENLEL